MAKKQEAVPVQNQEVVGAKEFAPTVARTRGVLLMAFGAPHYGQMCSNLAWALKVTSGHRIPVTLVYTRSAVSKLSSVHLNTHFDNLIEVGEDVHQWLGNNTAWGRAKVRMYEFSPYDDTIFIDADTMWFPQMNIETIFNGLGVEKGNVLWQNSGTSQIYEAAAAGRAIEHWINNAALIVDKFEWKNPYVGHIHSYLVYFRKSDEAARYFDDALKVYDFAAANNIPTMSWRGGVADEFCFSVAVGTSGLFIEPTRNHWKPLYQDHDGRSMPQPYLIRSWGHYGATTILSRPSRDWRNNYEKTYNAHFQGRINMCFYWKDKY